MSIPGIGWLKPAGDFNFCRSLSFHSFFFFFLFGPPNASCFVSLFGNVFCSRVDAFVSDDQSEDVFVPPSIGVPSNPRTPTFI